MSYSSQRVSQVDYSDNEDEEDEEVTAQLAFVDRTVYVSERMRRRKLLRCFIIIVPLLLGLIIGISIKESQKSSGSFYNHNKVSLVTPPADLSTKCSLEQIATKSGKQACRMICEPAECCDFPANLALSCLAGNEEKCRVYHSHCHVTEQGTTTPPANLPPAPKNLATLCSANAIATIDGFAQCQQKCSRASCCFEKDSAVCQVDQCADYAPCLTVGAINYVHTKIPVEITKSCASENLLTLEGRSLCRSACSHALCCFTEGGCPQKDSTFCDQYQNCDDLEHNLNAVSSEKEIKAECEVSTTEYTHMSLCEVECERGACCFVQEGCDGIFPDNDCSIYEPCAFLFIGGNENSKEIKNDDQGGSILKIDVDDACIGFDPAEKNAANADCTKYCAEAKCCFDTTMKCPDSVSCRIMEECKVIYGDESSDDTTKEEALKIDATDIYDACGGEEVANSGSGKPSLCEKLCQNGLCCLEEDEDCSNVSDCSMYEACKTLFGETLTGNENGSPTSVTSACSKNKALPTDAKDLAVCEKACQPGVCCFSQDGCSDTAIECKNYVPCTFFFSDGNGSTETHVTDSVSSACVVNGGLPTSSAGLAVCEEACQPGACCFSEIGCSDTTIECKNYVPCTFFFSDGNGSTETHVTDSVSSACSVNGGLPTTSAGLAVCEEACLPGACCFSETGCSDSSLDCRGYIPCAYFFSDGNGSTETHVTASIKSACSVNGMFPIESTGLAICEKVCQPGECCFSHDGCLDSTLDCQDFIPCTFFFSDGNGSTETHTTDVSSDTTGESTTDLVSSACSINGAFPTDLAGLDNCEKLCQRGACCFSNEGCADTNLDCQVYIPCTFYFSDGNGVTTDNHATDEAATAGSSLKPSDYNEAEVIAACDNDGSVSSMCETICKAGACCYDKSMSCPAGSVCEHYASCPAHRVLQALASVVAVEMDKGSERDFQGQGHSRRSAFLGFGDESESVVNPSKRFDAVATSNHDESFSSDEKVLETEVADIVHSSGLIQTQRDPGIDPDIESNIAGLSEDIPEYNSDFASRHLGGENLKDMLTNICIEDVDNEDHLETCKALCLKGACCFTNNNCMIPDDVQCLDYLPCFVLYHATGEDDDITISQLEEEADSDFEKASESENEEMITGHLPITHTGLTYEKIHTACTDQEAIHLPGMPSMCQQYCSQGICCFQEHQDCETDIDCSMFVPCASSASFGSTIAGMNSATTASITTVTSTSATANLDSFDKDDVKKVKVEEACDGSDMSHCVRKCAEAACCYALTESESCKETSPALNCEIYSSCDSVYGHKGDDGDEDNGRL